MEELPVFESVLTAATARTLTQQSYRFSFTLSIFYQK